MKFGIFALPSYLPEMDGSIDEFYRRIFSFLRESEQLGFNSAWVNEHHFHPYGGMIPSPPVLLAALAAQTTHIRLGTSVCLLPLHHPLQVAESYAMLDQISGGRLEFGVARGFVRNDYDTMGVGWDDAQRRLEEGLEVVLRAWQERPFSYTGQYYAFREVSVWPLPLQSPHPPVWGAATVSPSTFEWIGGQGFNLLTVSHLKSLPEMDGLIGAYRAAAEAAGHDPRGLQVSMHFQVYCAEDRDEALREGGEARKRYIALADSVRLRGNVLAPPREELPIEQMVAESRICIGTPDDCAEVIERARRHLNLTQVDCSFYFGGLDYEKAQRSFRLFASEVMPRFRTASAALPGR